MATAGILTIRAANTPEQHVQAVYKAEQDINSTKTKIAKLIKQKERMDLLLLPVGWHLLAMTFMKIIWHWPLIVLTM